MQRTFIQRNPSLRGNKNLFVFIKRRKKNSPRANIDLSIRRNFPKGERSVLSYRPLLLKYNNLPCERAASFFHVLISEHRSSRDTRRFSANSERSFPDRTLKATTAGGWRGRRVSFFFLFARARGHRGAGRAGRRWKISESVLARA